MSQSRISGTATIGIGALFAKDEVLMEKERMKNYAVVTLDATGSMTGEEGRVVSSMNEYVT